MAKTPFTIEGGFGYIERDGKKAYVVKSGLTDYGTLAVREQMMQLENKFDYRDALYDLSTHPSIEASYALVVPKHVDKMVQRIVNEGHDAVSNFLKNNNAAQATNIWKRMALFSAQFIGSNVIGGTAIAMIHNPLMGHKIMLSGLERGALKAGIKDYSTIVADDAALTYHLAYELRHNIFSEEAGIRNLTDARHAGKLKKYGWNGGYTVVAAFEHMLRTLVAKDFLQRDPVFKAFMGGPETRRYVENGIDFAGSRRKNISNFEAAADLTLDPTSEFFQADLKTRMRYVTDTVSGNYHSFAPSEQFVRNFLSPFYAWQRHSLAFTTRLPIDSPIKANIGSQFGQYGYQQQLADGNLPSFMYQTIPLPEFISSTLGLDKNTRVDMSNITPFGATADMAGALVQALTTQRVGRNVFSFSHPGINALIKSVLNVDPQTGIPIRPGEENGLLHNIAQTFENTPMFKVPKTLTWDLIQGAYSQDAMTRKFAQVDNPADILSGYDSTADPSKPWSLKVPRELMIAQSGSYKEQALKTLSPIRFYAVNVDRMSLIAKKEAVAIAALHGMRNDANKSRVEEYVARVRKWKALNDVVQHVWLPKAISSGFDPKQIAIVLAKVESDKPTKGSFGVSFDDVLKAIGG